MNIWEAIKYSKKVVCGKTCDEETIDLCQKRLCAYGAAPMPISYTDFLRKINGITGDGISLFGVGVNGLFDDVFIKNSMTREPLNHRIFLGENLTEFLCYEWYQKAYIIISKQDGNEKRSFVLLDEALIYMLRDYIDKT